MATSYLLKNKNLLKNVKTFKQRMQEEDAAVQQSDYLEDFMLKILNDGLDKAYEEYGDCSPGPSPPKYDQTVSPAIEDGTQLYDVIVVGAGIAGLAAAYEMKRVKLKVKILEQTERYGGRIFTYSNDLAPGLYGEGM
jgi:hypothetical protein